MFTANTGEPLRRSLFGRIENLMLAAGMGSRMFIWWKWQIHRKIFTAKMRIKKLFTFLPLWTRLRDWKGQKLAE